MGEVVQFPRYFDAVLSEGVERVEMIDPPEMCEGVLHIFDEVPGTCRCGTETWTPEGLLDPPGEAIGLHIAS